MHGGSTDRHPRRRRWRSRLRPSDLLSVGTYGLRGRKGRASLTAVGIAIGIAAIVSVFGISASSRADVLAQIDELGTDLLVIRAGNDVFGAGSHLPEESTAMVRRVGPVDAASAVSTLDTEVRRNRYMTTQNGLDVLAAEAGLIGTLDGALATGRWVDEQLGRLPVVVLGAVAAERLGIEAIQGVDHPAGLPDLPGNLLGIDLNHPPVATGQVISFATERDIDAILAIDDSATLVAASANAALGRPHNDPESALAARDKWVMRQAFARAGLPVPLFTRFPVTADPAGLVKHGLETQPHQLVGGDHAGGTGTDDRDLGAVPVHRQGTEAARVGEPVVVGEREIGAEIGDRTLVGGFGHGGRVGGGHRRSPVAASPA